MLDGFTVIPNVSAQTAHPSDFQRRYLPPPPLSSPCFFFFRVATLCTSRTPRAFRVSCPRSVHVQAVGGYPPAPQNRQGHAPPAARPTAASPIIPRKPRKSSFSSASEQQTKPVGEGVVASGMMIPSSAILASKSGSRRGSKAEAEMRGGSAVAVNGAIVGSGGVEGSSGAGDVAEEHPSV